MSKTFRQIWKKLGDGVTPKEAANSLLLVEMGCIRLRNIASTFVQMTDITEEIAKCYIEMFMRYVNYGKNVSSKNVWNEEYIFIIQLLGMSTFFNFKSFKVDIFS